MASSDTEGFLVDLLTRYDPNLDVTAGSDAYTALVEPILARIGTDPFDVDFETFIRTRIQQTRPELAISEADELTDLLIDPMRILLEPVSREIQLVKLRTALNNSESLSDAEVDALMANFFEPRRGGGFAQGVVRAYFAAPQNITVTLINIAQSQGGLRFLVPSPQTINASQMLLNLSGSEYYFDINFIAETRGDEYNVGAGEILSISNLSSATRVTNLRRFENGISREDSATFIGRVQQGTSDKTLTTEPGIVAVLNEAFPSLRTLFSVGYGDPEMRRDVVTGGGLGPIPANDDLGEFFGVGSPVDDGDADDSTPLLEASTGNFVTRVGAAGLAPDGWYVTIVYASAQLVVKDSKVLEVVSDTRVRLADELPLTLDAGAVTWMLRRRTLTLSGIPGGITFPDTPSGEVTLPSDGVHIGGKTDVFVAGAVEASSVQITNLSDEGPLARGSAAQTQGATPGSEELVVLPDVDLDLFALVQPGMSLVLSEGTDVGAYRIVEVLSSPPRVRLDTLMTGSQSNLTWRIVDEIDVDLVAPKDVLLEGSDLILSGNSSTAIVGGGVNFLGAGIRTGDVLFVDNDEYGGDFTITDVTATAMLINPPAPRALSGVHYVVSRRSHGVQLPVLRVSGLELLDSAGAPNGTVIPYRDPVLTLSNGFQNEGTGLLYDGPARLGLLSQGFVEGSPTPTVLFETLDWTVHDPERPYAAPLSAGTFTFATYDALDFQTIADDINANAMFRAAGVRAAIVRYAGLVYVGLASQRLITITGGSALGSFGWQVGDSNAQVRTDVALADLKVRRGDLIEFVGGSNGGRSVRALTEPNASGIRVGGGPLGPASTTALYDAAPLNPDARGRIRVGRPSVGTLRAYFLAPTSVDFGYRETRFQTTINGVTRVYQPDPENTRVILPPPPTVALPSTGTLDVGVLSDANASFLRAGVRQGDLLDVLYQPLQSTDVFDGTVQLSVGGQSLVIQLDNDPLIDVSFPYAMLPDDVASYINTQTGVQLASIQDDFLVLSASRAIKLMPSSTALGTLQLATASNDHPKRGTYIVSRVAETELEVSTATPVTGPAVLLTQYRIRRYLQRASSTEMNLNVDASGLYYADVEAISATPGDASNIGTGVELEASGYRSDGYRLVSKQPELSYSRAEQLGAQLSRTILLPGASDNPLDYVQLNLQNVQVSYDRSALADDIQSFCASRYRRVLCEDILVRHLLPHYVSLNWRYIGGLAEPAMTRALLDGLSKIEGGGELEVGALIDILRKRQATSVFAADPTSANGRTAPLLLVVKHSETRQVQASLVRDIVETVRMCTYLPDNIQLRRLSSSGLR